VSGTAGNLEGWRLRTAREYRYTGLTVAPVGGMMQPGTQSRKVRRFQIKSTFAAVIAVVATLLLLGAAVVFRHPHEPGTAQTSRHGIGLKVERAGQVLLVAWDRSSQPVHNASHAILYIKDGPQRSKLDLNIQQLRAANVQYWPETQKVTFTLDVYQGEGSISQSVEVTNTAPVTAAQPKRPTSAQPDLASGSLEANASMESARPSPFAVRIRREPSMAASALDPQPRVIVTAAETPPSTAAETPDQESRLGRMLSKIPLLRRLKKHPQQPENESPLK
jgi:hypothetical protein